MRLDSFLVMQEAVSHSRSYLSALISNGHVTVESSRVSKPAFRVKSGQEVRLEVPDPRPVDLAPLEMDLDISYEDEYLVVLNKPAGLVVHPSGTHRSETLVNALLAHCEKLSGIGGEIRPGIVHRLDKDTTGLMMVAKDDSTHRELSFQLARRTVKRRYLALVWGHPHPADGRVDQPIGRDPYHRKRMGVVGGGKRAVTNYRILEKYRLASKIACRLETGRTHQIRVHMAHSDCPLIADWRYGGHRPTGIPSTARNRALVSDVLRLARHQMLHAETLGFIHPVTEESMEFHSAPPLEFRLVEKRLLEDMNE
ncbi:RluA family pseudouridine synthase [Candidatus Fermentibacteria bacterium]|nr:RluA family pseudouridine synthase [Candidatus Fermentibacteria bacterium]